MLVLSLLGLLALPQAPARDLAPTPPHLEQVAVFSTRGSSAEILTLQPSTRRLLLTHARKGTVELFDLTEPSRPRAGAVLELDLRKSEELTSVAVPGRGDWFLACVRDEEPLAQGRVLALSLPEGRLLAEFPSGVHPDCISIDPGGNRALVANEAEAFVAGPDGAETQELRSAPGTLTLIELTEPLQDSRVIQLPLWRSGLTLPTDGRLLRRRVGGEERLIPLEDGAEFLEPEGIAFSADGHQAWITLQENNALARIELDPPRLVEIRALGTTRHAADLLDDGQFEESGELQARREPDGVAVSLDGRLLVTADEGATEPDAAHTPSDRPCAGGRTLSVFDAGTLALLGDTGAQLDRSAAAAGLYPDTRSPRKGSEPEMVVCLQLLDVPYAVLTLERAGGLALIDLSVPARPTVVSLAATGKKPGEDLPEGLCHFRDPSGGEDWIYVANEGTSTLGVLQIVH